MKKIALLLPALMLSAMPAKADVIVQAPVTIEHDGSRYTYTVTQKNGLRIIRGQEEKSFDKFTLYVGRYMVTGTYGNADVSFPLKSVKPLTGIVQIASR